MGACVVKLFGGLIMPDDVVMKTPNEKLAEQVKDALCEAGLITDSHRAELLEKLEAGNAASEDWSLWIDMATASESEESTDE